MSSTVNIVVVTRNRSLCATTLHSILNLNGHCLMNGIHINLSFVEDRLSLPKVIKTGERIVFFDYAVNVDEGSISTLIRPFEKGINVLVYPAAKEFIDWNMFRKKTLGGSKEAACQRGIHFDTEIGNKLYDDVYEVTKTSARVWAMDSKPVDKKLRGGKNQVMLPTDSEEAMFDTLRSIGVKIGALTSATVICHFTFECVGNILETSGVKINN